MSENPNPQPDITSQFRELGENMKSFFHSTWESEEIQNGLNELSKAINETVEDVKTSKTGQRIKSEAEDLKARVETGEVEEKARAEISKVLEFLNAELAKLNQQVKSTESAPPPADKPE